MSKPSWLKRKKVDALTPEDIERAVLLGTIVLALSGSFTDQDRKRGSIITLRQGINKMNRRTVKGKKLLANKLASMTTEAWEVSFKLDPTVRKYSSALLMTIIWHKYKGILCFFYGDNVERALDTIVNRLHDINDPEYADVEISTQAVAQNVVNAVNKVIYDRRDK